ncbi:lysophospholipid acyltransferase family protein [Chondrinema litorale]|uniref:lysophospholipid acyltransferase family protein n=1 Tax=Chondrinema litorale TaxID=2994555 RepID=UPI0025435062|nr:lysophospholipid acyltransferase family protein [Chondrinema litorale]UZR95561.1 lysophospholipid acyltransferase family protein [Chondrinema litorale]
MLKLLKTLYAIWGFLCFIVYYLALFPLFALIVQKHKWHKHARWINQFWASIVFTSILMPIKVIKKGVYNSKEPYIFCANHNSYLDIPVVGFSAPRFVVFVGKSSLTKIPLFGYMFKRLHIPVNRRSIKDSYRSFEDAKKAVEKKHSLLIFPEGGINDQNIPDLKKFKDGAFRIAIEKQIPIVPVTIPYNWIILPDETLQLTWNLLKIVYHEPIITEGMTMEQLPELKEQVRDVIRKEMSLHFPSRFKNITV